MVRLQVVIGLLAAVLVFMAGDSDVARADPDTVQAGHDLLETDSSNTYLDLLLPFDFFGPGCEPFEGRILLEGEPHDSFAGYDGLSPTDTIVERLQDAPITFPDSIGREVHTEILSLDLKSVAPMTVTCPGGAQSWEMRAQVPEGDPNQETGTMTIRHEFPDGGTFDIVLPVRPKLTFTRLDGPGVIGPFYWPEPPDPSYLVFEAYDEPWCHTANPLDDPPGHVVIEKPPLTSNFFPGIVCGPPRTKDFFVLDDEWKLFGYFASHGVRPAENPAPPVGGIAALPNVSDSSGRSYVALAALAAAALVALSASGWYARRRLS